MENKEFERLIQLVSDMRNKQNDYFRCRSSMCLSAAKKAEKEVDIFIKKYTSPSQNELTLNF